MGISKLAKPDSSILESGLLWLKERSELLCGLEHLPQSLFQFGIGLAELAEAALLPTGTRADMTAGNAHLDILRSPLPSLENAVANLRCLGAGCFDRAHPAKHVAER